MEIKEFIKRGSIPITVVVASIVTATIMNIHYKRKEDRRKEAAWGIVLACLDDNAETDKTE